MQDQTASRVETLGSADVDCVFLFDKFLSSRSLTAEKEEIEDLSDRNLEEKMQIQSASLISFS